MSHLHSPCTHTREELCPLTDPQEMLLGTRGDPTLLSHGCLQTLWGLQKCCFPSPAYPSQNRRTGGLVVTAVAVAPFLPGGRNGQRGILPAWLVRMRDRLRGLDAEMLKSLFSLCSKQE